MPPKRVCGVPSSVTAPNSSAGLASEVGDSSRAETSSRLEQVLATQAACDDTYLL